MSFVLTAVAELVEVWF